MREKSIEFSVLASDFVENNEGRFRNRFYQNLRSFIGEDFLIADATGRVIVSTIDIGNDFEVIKDFSDEVLITYDYSDFFEERTLSAISRMSDGSYTVLFTSVDAIYSSYIYLARIVMISLFISTTFSIFVAFVVSYKFTKPIKKMTDVTKDIAKGNYGSKVSIFRDDQLGELSSSIDNMSTTISESIEEIKRLEKLSNELVANVSHEFKTPLTIINGYIHSMKDKKLKRSDEIYDKILSNTNTLEMLVDDILTLNDYQFGNVNLNKEETSISEMVLEALFQLDFLIKSKNININFESNNDVSLKVDRLKFKQMLLIIIDNAIKFSSEGSKIDIKLGEKGIEVKDFGKGIKKADQAKIFERYYKVDKKSSGHGIGLFIVKNIADDHGFNISLKSSINKGTIIFVKFYTFLCKP